MNTWIRVAAISLLTVIALGATQHLSAQVHVESSAAKIDFGGRVQVQAGTSSCSDYALDGDPDSACEEDVPFADTFIRRVRLAIDIDFNEWISAKIQPEFGKINGFRLADAYGRLNLQPEADNTGAQITLGHFKRPFDIFALTSSTEFLTVERAVLARGLPSASYGAITALNRWGDRDVGVMIDGGTTGDRFHYWAGVFNGGLDFENADDGGKQFVGRAQVRVRDGDLPLKVGVAGSLNQQPFTDDNEELQTKAYEGWELFAELGDFGDPGIHVQAALIGGKNSLQNEMGDDPDLVAGDEFADLITWQAIGGWRFDTDNFWVEGVQPVFRITMADPNKSIEKSTVWGFTPGVQVFFDGRNKIMLNWDFISFADDRRSENSFKIRYQFHF
ncbi:MAG: OprO/OprP family phosphate-selective porin [Gemmatimonadota bacterium]|nr:OprO/OprP family phosphate-selective porin [Gemmatimonadota bacterium]